MPAHIAPYKSENAEDPGAEHRLAMCRLAVAGVDGLAVSALELERGGVSYTVDTLTALQASDPGAELTLIVGADVASTLSSWREPARLLALARLAVAGRPGSSRQGLLDQLAALSAEAPARARFLEMAPLAVSSSLVRERAARGEPLEELVGAPVARYIAEHDLYRVSSGVST